MKQWAHGQFEATYGATGTGPSLTFSYEEDEEEGPQMHIAIHETSKDFLNPDSLATRIACYVYIARMPEEGLAEVSETLRDTYRFYHHLLPPNTFPSLPSTRVAAQHGRTYEREPFHAEE